MTDPRRLLSIVQRDDKYRDSSSYMEVEESIRMRFEWPTKEAEQKTCFADRPPRCSIFPDSELK